MAQQKALRGEMNIARETAKRANERAAKALQQVADVRVLGAIAVIEMQEAVDMRRITNDFINAGVWLRPFGRLVYIMPNYNMSDEELFSLAKAMVNVVGLQ